MTFRELHERLGEVIATNERHGHPERNNSPVVMELRRGRNNWYIPIRGASSVLLTLDGEGFLTIFGDECEAIKFGQRQAKQNEEEGDALG